MATITSAASGNFSDTATWVGGVVPTVGDTAVAATGHVVAIDVDVTVDAVDQAGTGKFTLGNGRTLTAEVIARAGTFTSGGTVEVTATAGNTATIVGDVTSSGLVTNGRGITVTGSGTLELYGTVFSSNLTAASAMVSTATSCTINIFGALDGRGFVGRTQCVDISGSSVSVNVVGNVYPASNPGNGEAIRSSASPATITIVGDIESSANSLSVSTTGAQTTVTVIGDVAGGGGSAVHGIRTTGVSDAVTVTGAVTAGSGANANGILCTGGSSLIDLVGSAESVGTSSHGIRSDATSAGFGVRFSGNLIDSPSGVVACYSRFFRIQDTSPSGITQYANDDNFPTGGLVSRVSPDLVTGMAAQSDVRAGLAYGFNDELTGALAVPPAEAVSFGVPVDNTTGTAALNLGDVAAVTGAQIAAALG
jgi:hypothetical protein